MLGGESCPGGSSALFRDQTPLGATCICGDPRGACAGTKVWEYHDIPETWWVEGASGGFWSNLWSRQGQVQMNPGCPRPPAAELSIPQGCRSQDLSELYPGAASCSSWFVFPNVVSCLHHLGLPMHPLLCLGVPSPVQTPQILAVSWGITKSLVSAGEGGRVKTCSPLPCESTCYD